MTFRVTQAYADPGMARIASWIATMLDASTSTAAQLPVTRPAIVAQAALETGWGRSAIGHNLFGIKADPSWKGEIKRVPTQEVYNGQRVTIDDNFRDYASYEDSIADHFAFLKQNRRYLNCFGCPDDVTYFRNMQADGYATDPNYAQSLMAVRQTVINFAATMADDAAAPATVTPLPHIDHPDHPLANHILMAGCMGDDVMILQERLAILPRDGRFGSLTFNAVVAWQKSAGLQADGVVGPATIASLGL